MSASGRANALGDADLVDGLKTGKVDLTAVQREELPLALQSLDIGEQEKLVARTAQLRAQMKDLAAQRNDYLGKKVQENSAAGESLDAELYGAIRSQAAKKSMRYSADGIRY